MDNLVSFLPSFIHSNIYYPAPGIIPGSGDKMMNTLAAFTEPSVSRGS